MSDVIRPAALRDPQALLTTIRRQWSTGDLWVFGYASLIWRPEFDADEHRPAWVHGWHRALRLRSRLNRGTPETPGLVFALMPGGSCRGVVYRVARVRAEGELERLWAREMMTGVYDPRWLGCRTSQGPVMALAFTLSRQSPHYTGRMADDEVLQVLRCASGRYGRSLDYLVETANCLRAHGMRDREVDRLVAMARRQGLV